MNRLRGATIIASQNGTVLKLTIDQARCISAGVSATGSGAVSAVTLSTTAMYIAQRRLRELAAEQRVHGGVPRDTLDDEPGAQHALEAEAGALGDRAGAGVVALGGDPDPVDRQRLEDPARQEPHRPGRDPTAARAGGEPVADLAAALVALDAEAIPIAPSSSSLPASTITRWSSSPGPERHSPIHSAHRRSVVVVGNARPAQHLGIQRCCGDAFEIGVGVQTQPDDAVVDPADRELDRGHRPQAGCEAAARSATSSAMSTMIRFRSKSLGV